MTFGVEYDIVCLEVVGPEGRGRRKGAGRQCRHRGLCHERGGSRDTSLGYHQWVLSSSWTGGTAPDFLSVYHHGRLSATPTTANPSPSMLSRAPKMMIRLFLDPVNTHARCHSIKQQILLPYLHHRRWRSIPWRPRRNCHGRAHRPETDRSSVARNGPSF